MNFNATIKGYKWVKAPNKAVLKCIKKGFEPYGKVEEINNNTLIVEPNVSQLLTWELFSQVSKVVITVKRNNDIKKIEYIAYYFRIKLWLLIFSIIPIVLTLFSNVTITEGFMFCIGSLLVIWGFFGTVSIIDKYRIGNFFERIVNDNFR